MFFRHQESLDIFIEVYKAYPVSFLGREDVENSNSVVLPPSALDKLSMLSILFYLIKRKSFWRGIKS
jgi:hypothetical protein